MDELLIKIDERQLCNYLLDLAKEYYADPDHQRAYNDWCAWKNKKALQEGNPAGWKVKRDEQQIKPLTS